MDVKTLLVDLNVQLEYHISLVTLHNKEAAKIRDRIRKLKRGAMTKDIIITDHSVVSYMKRFKHEVLGLDVDEVRDIIKGIVTEEGLKIGGNGKLRFGDVTYVVKNHKVITIYNTKNED